jgi:hypothetical protein
MITIKENQSLGFNITSDSCKCGGVYCQPILTTDKTMIQGYVTPQSNVNLVTDGDFAASTNWNLGAGWSISAGKLFATNIAGTTATSNLPIGLTQDRIYLIRTKVTVTSVGSATPGNGWKIKVNDQLLSLPQLTANNSSLTGTWLFKCAAIATDVVEFSTNESTIDFNVDYFEMYELSEVGMALYNGSTLIDDNTTFTGSNFLHYIIDYGILTSGSILYEGDYAYNEEVVSFNLYIDDWSTITTYTGCATIKIYDLLTTYNHIRNSYFDASYLLSYWTAGADWAWNSSKACYTRAAISRNFLTQTFYVPGGSEYLFEFTVDGIAAGKEIEVIFTTPLGIDSWFYQTDGNKSQSFDLSSFSGQQTMTISFSESTSNPELTFCIDRVTCTSTAPDSLNESACINLAETHDCTLLFTATNDDNAFGFDYSTETFKHYLRVKAKYAISSFPEEKEDYLFSDNSRRLLFARRDTEYGVKVTDAPEYIHACLSMMRLNDTFTIDGNEYIATGNYEYKTRKTSELAQADFSVVDTNGIASNYSCS